MEKLRTNASESDRNAKGPNTISGLPTDANAVSERRLDASEPHQHVHVGGLHNILALICYSTI